MTYDNIISEPVAELMASQNEEVAKYRLLESQLKGHDIGWKQASDEWFEKHFADWARGQRRMIDKDLSMTDESLGITSETGVLELQPLLACEFRLLADPNGK